ncbi:MAG TPA: CRTAC1 family protein, partial [Pirellula sp.]|nr:CRTAC1 family protein [Pirellula sp.]
YIKSIRTAAELAAALGRKWESIAWCNYALSIDKTASWTVPILEESRIGLNINSPRTRAESNLAMNVDWLDDYPLKDWKRIPLMKTLEDDPVRHKKVVSSADIRFENVTSNTGIDFTFFASQELPIDGRKIFQNLGGGVGVIDYDNDGWPDLFFAQGTTLPPESSNAIRTDRLYRNQGLNSSNDNTTFVEVTSQANLCDSDYGQGVTVGDINCDGFDDLYICNLRKNKLWLNQGDGTYIDGTRLIESNTHTWTASAVIVDINLDGLPEIYDVNYLAGDDVLTLMCDVGGKMRACSTIAFPPAKGRLLVSTSSGTFEEAGPLVKPDSIREGNGLGVVAFRLDGEQHPSIFVANDQVANLFLCAVPKPGSQFRVQLEDHGLVSGLSYNGAGRVFACMGVATSDVNGDGRLDILVTNFYNEGSTLYLQQDGGLFLDGTAAAGLVAPSISMLGFGCQFLDAQLDGQPDLVVLNGHIDDFSHMDIPFQMRPQVFQNMGDGKFDEVRGTVGEFFKTPALGRALAKLDMDCDGLEDLVVTDLEANATLLHNCSKRNGAYLTIKLVGTKSDRNAFGTKVTVQVGAKTYVQQLVAGSGYMASNQRHIHFGLPNATRADSIQIDWPSGNQSRFQNVTLNQSLLMVEDNARIHGNGMMREAE